jgi:AP-2 complex subunit sigma-1
MTIHFFLIQNTQGVTRLSKWWYPSVTHQDKLRLEAEVHRMLAYRKDDETNFVAFTLGKATCKLVFRRYASLLFTLCVDQFDNDLAMLESIHLVVEVLDAYFKNVCEVDIIFNFPKVFSIVDEVFLAGEFQEMCGANVLAQLEELERLD